MSKTFKQHEHTIEEFAQWAQGHKVRKVDWSEGRYLHKLRPPGYEGVKGVDENGNVLLVGLVAEDGEWEYYEEVTSASQDPVTKSAILSFLEPGDRIGAATYSCTETYIARAVRVAAGNPLSFVNNTAKVLADLVASGDVIAIKLEGVATQYLLANPAMAGRRVANTFEMGTHTAEEFAAWAKCHRVHNTKWGEGDYVDNVEPAGKYACTSFDDRGDEFIIRIDPDSTWVIVPAEPVSEEIPPRYTTMAEAYDTGREDGRSEARAAAEASAGLEVAECTDMTSRQYGNGWDRGCEFGHSEGLKAQQASIAQEPEQKRFTANGFAGILSAIRRLDTPLQLQLEALSPLIVLANAEAQARGYKSWVEAARDLDV